MIGAIIGDIVGSVYEFNNIFDYDFPLFCDEGSYTDDTICTVAVADAILTGKNYRDSLLEWCHKYPSPMGCYGGSFSQWLTSDNPRPYNSFGNGSAMRVSPVGWAFGLEEKVLEEAKKTAVPTHNHPEGVKGAQAVAHLIYVLRKGESEEVLRQIARLYYPDFESSYFVKGRFDETCMGTVPLALQIFFSSTSFEDAVRRAVAFGGDSDTLGAIVGSLAEAGFGIPEDILKKGLSYLPEDMLAVVERFCERYKSVEGLDTTPVHHQGLTAYPGRNRGGEI